jgi:hypothetical protein
MWPITEVKQVRDNSRYILTETKRGALIFSISPNRFGQSHIDSLQEELDLRKGFNGICVWSKDKVRQPGGVDASRYGK